MPTHYEQFRLWLADHRRVAVHSCACGKRAWWEVSNLWLNPADTCPHCGTNYRQQRPR